MTSQRPAGARQVYFVAATDGKRVRGFRGTMALNKCRIERQNAEKGQKIWLIE